MVLCAQGHKNMDDNSYCSTCSYPLNIPDEEKIVFLKNKLGGDITFEATDSTVHLLDLTKVNKYNIDLGFVFPNLTNLIVKANKLVDSELLSNLNNLRYLTLNLKVLGGKAKLPNNILDLLPQSIQSLTITVDEHEIDDTIVIIPEKLLSYLQNLKNLFIYCTPENIKFLSSGHQTLDTIEIMGEGFEFDGRIMNFPCLTAVTAEYRVTKLHLELVNLPNLEKLIINLEDNQSPISIKSSNADYELELTFNQYHS